MIRFRFVLFAALALTSACAAPQADSISGTIRMPEALQANLGESDTIFIIAQPAGEAGGPPLAVKRMVGVKFPLDYTFDREDVIRPGVPFTGKVNIRATMRKSGIANVAVPGDLSGAYASNPVAVGAQHVDFTLDQVQR